jgi:outer membrane protein TolC
LLLDKERAALERTRWGVDGARAYTSGARLKLQEGAARAYWAWVRAGYVLEVEEELVEVAEERAIALTRQVESGAIAPVLLVDNQRVLLSRRASAIDAQRKLDQAAQKLGYYLRDADGAMTAPGRDRLPPLEQERPPPPPLEDAERRLLERPELRGLQAKLQQVDVDQRLADNDLWPRVTAKLYAAQDLGDEVAVGLSSTSNKPEVFFGVGVSLPLQRRRAQAKATGARAKAARLEAQRRQVIDELGVVVRNARTQYDAAARSVELERGALAAARTVEAAERRRFEEGQSDLLAVNLREQATAAEARKLVGALTSLAEADALYRLAAGMSALASTEEADG